MANPQAEEKDYVDGFKVSQVVFETIKNLDPLSWQFVVIKSALRKGDTERFAAVVMLDLSGLGRYTKILSGSEENLGIFDNLFTEGMPPEAWLEPYLAQAI